MTKRVILQNTFTSKLIDGFDKIFNMFSLDGIASL